MRIQPLKSYHQPAYPTRVILDAQPELLRLTPRRWQRNAVVLGALATICTITAVRWSRAAGTPQDVSLVAPVFQHGEGRGSFGCVAVNPPTFLSEEEARQVIVDEGKKAGIVFAPDALTLSEVAIPFTSLSPDKSESGSKLQPLTLDGWDARRKVGYEYVSQDDYMKWKIEPSYSTAESFDLRKAADGLRDGLAQAKPAGAVGVFYDPLVSYNASMDQLVKTDKFSDATLVSVQVIAYISRGTVAKSAHQVKLILGGRRVVFDEGSNIADLDGMPFNLGHPAVRLHGILYVPLKPVADKLGLEYHWDAARATLTMKGVDAGENWETTLVRTTETDPAQQLTLAYHNNDWEWRAALAKEQAGEVLRQQVRDFITWLKAQGAI